MAFTTIIESSSIAEELLSGITDLQQKCSAIHRAVAEGFFSLEEALELYMTYEEE